MLTITYPDEPTPVTYRREIDRQILEYLKYLFGVSIREAHEMVRQIILRELDPINVRGGEPFVFSGAVPDPYANVVDLLEAWDLAVRDAQHCRYVLENEPSTATLMLACRRLFQIDGSAEYDGEWRLYSDWASLGEAISRCAMLMVKRRSRRVPPPHYVAMAMLVR